MSFQYPTYQYTDEDVKSKLASFVRLDNPQSYPFDSFHAHEYSEIMVFTKGGGTHNINFKNHTIQDGAIHLIASNDLHWVERAMDSEGFAIVYKEQFLEKLQMVNPELNFSNIFAQSKVINLNTAEKTQYQLIIQELLASKDQSAYLLQLIGAFMVKIALSQMSTAETTPRQYDLIVVKLIALIEKNFKKRLKTADYAALLNITPRTLHNRIKQSTGLSLAYLQQERLIKEAKRMLCFSNMNVSEISFELGFKDSAYFSNWFKKATQYLPSEYKYGQ